MLKANRRGFLAALMALPFAGKAKVVVDEFADPVFTVAPGGGYAQWGNFSLAENPHEFIIGGKRFARVIVEQRMDGCHGWTDVRRLSTIGRPAVAVSKNVPVTKRRNSKGELEEF